MSIWSSIRDLRKSRKWTQSKLADVSGMHQGDISKIESGKVNVEVATLEAISSALDAEFVLVPRRALGAVRNTIDMHLHHKPSQPFHKVQSVRDELFIPDGDEDDDDTKVSNR